MDAGLTGFLAALLLLSIIPSWLTGSIIKREAKKEGAAGWDWLPMGLLPYALARFKHPSKFAIVWGYVFSNLLLLGTLAAIIVLWKKGR